MSPDISLRSSIFPLEKTQFDNYIPFMHEGNI